MEYIHLWCEATSSGLMWAANGYVGTELAAPDIAYEDFHDFIRHLSKHVGDGATWTDLQQGDQITAWQAMVRLSDNQGVNT
ncbi:hypothetical protein [Aurantiacibacter sp. MUD61]|uniref:hypothetical protein n=1 Tax=Aurantiacibacter sp. MUD61 TaxID=3009083 RepID=UPI0022F06670|nr:hypothetical protein [Aurantiacibacter sp. MUD61]